MTVRIRRLRPQVHEKAAEALQLLLDLPLPLRPEVRAELTDALSSYAPEPWPFVMLNRTKAREILKLINAGERPGVTVSVWLAALSYATYGTGEISASRQDIAEAAGTTEREVSRALSRLVMLGALIRTGRGCYALDPSAAWSGSLERRERAKARRLELVGPE